MSLKDIQDTMNNTGAVSSIAVSEGKLGVTITIKSSILFEGETDGFSRESTRVLSAVARILNRIDNPVVITGHTDSIPVETPRSTPTGACPQHGRWPSWPFSSRGTSRAAG